MLFSKNDKGKWNNAVLVDLRISTTPQLSKLPLHNTLAPSYLWKWYASYCQSTTNSRVWHYFLEVNGNILEWHAFISMLQKYTATWKNRQEKPLACLECETRRHITTNTIQPPIHSDGRLHNLRNIILSLISEILRLTYHASS